MSISTHKTNKRNSWVSAKTIASVRFSAPIERTVKKSTSVPQLPAQSNLCARQKSQTDPDHGRRRASSALYSLAGLINKSNIHGHSKPRLRPSKSESSLGLGPKRSNNDRVWKLTYLLTKAKRRLSITDDNSDDTKYKNPLLRKKSLKGFWTAATMKTTETEKRRMIRDLKLKAKMHKRSLKAKFKLAVRLTIFCSRTFKQHCLRINEQNDELAPYIKRLHFHEEDNTDLLIDLSKFKANRQMRIPEETKRILSMECSERSDKEVYTVTLALKNIKCFAEYPKRMQNKLAEVGLYEKYESKRVIIRQSHPASAFYFILSGAVIVMVMDEDSKYARPVAHLYKGQTFGELAIINGTKRNSTVIAKETCEFMSISQRDYHKIFMAGGVKNINDPDQDIFLKSLHCLAGWPIHIMQDNLTKCQFLFFKNGEVIVRDSHFSDWLIIVKSGSVQVLKKLKRVEAFEWKKKQPIEPMNNSTRRDIVLKRMEWRRVLPELGIPLQHKSATENVTEFLGNGKPVPFIHPEQRDDDTVSTRSEQSAKKVPQIPNLWPFKVNLSEIESGRYIDDQRDVGLHSRSHISKSYQRDKTSDNTFGRRLNRLTINQNLQGRERSNSMIEEEEDELLGYQPHIRTIIEDIDGGNNKKEDDTKPADINPEFVHVQTLTKGQVFGLTDMIIGDQPSFSVVSRGADCLLINKNFYLEHASEKLLRDMRQELCPYPTEEELQERLQVSVDWQAYKKIMLIESVENVSTKRLMRSSLKGTKTQEAFAY